MTWNLWHVVTWTCSMWYRKWREKKLKICWNVNQGNLSVERFPDTPMLFFISQWTGIPFIKLNTGTFWMIQWLRLCTSTAEDAGVIPGWGTRLAKENNKHTKHTEKVWESKVENNKGSSKVLDYGEHDLHSSYSLMFHFYWNVLENAFCFIS